MITMSLELLNDHFASSWEKLGLKRINGYWRTGGSIKQSSAGQCVENVNIFTRKYPELVNRGR